jgi:hypothetical protein
MDDTENIQVVIDGENEDAGALRDSIAAADRQAAKYRAEAAAATRRTSAYNIEAARLKVDSDLLTTGSELQAAEAAYREAREVGDIDLETKAQRRLAAAEARRTPLETQAEAISRAPISSGDNFEDNLSRYTDRTADWMRNHRDWVEDPKRNARMVGAHHMAIADGLQPDSDEYFQHCERTLGIRSGGGNGSSNRGANGMKRETPKYDPSDHRTHVTSDGVYLTENERKLAVDGTLVFNYGPKRGQPIGIQEMARRKAEMAKQGMYNRI